MAVLEAAVARWQIAQVLGEEDPEPTIVKVVAAKIDAKTANSLIRELNSKAPLPSLGHVKRVQRSKKDGTLDLSIILCTDERAELGEEIVLPSVVSDVVKRYCLQPFMAMVSGQPAKSREEWEMQCQLWPTSFHPNSGKSEKAELSQADADTMCYFMEKAIEQARQACRQGQLANGAVIVDPALGAIIATGCDGTAMWCGGSSASPGCQSGEKLESPPHDKWHPLQHATMVAIEMAAERDRRLWPAEEETGVSHKRQRSTEENSVGESGIGADGSIRHKDQDIQQESILVEVARPYLCTSFDLYVTREPCTMCAMAMVHQRIRRVIYGIPNSLVGALGSRYKLHGVKSLNHHYTVFQISLSEADLL